MCRPIEKEEGDDAGEVCGGHVGGDVEPLEDDDAARPWDQVVELQPYNTYLLAINDIKVRFASYLNPCNLHTRAPLVRP